MSTDRRILFASLLAVALLFSGGCALFDPHRGQSLTKVQNEFRKQETTSSAISNAVAYATDTWDAYNSALKWHSKAKISGGLATTALAAGAVSAGAVGASPDLVLGLGSGAAATFAGTTLLVSRPRQLVYLSGMAAVTCAVSAIRPFDLSAADFESLEKGESVNVYELQRLKRNSTVLEQETSFLLERQTENYKRVTNALLAIPIFDGTETIQITYQKFIIQLLTDIAWLKQIEVKEVDLTEDERKAAHDQIAALLKKGEEYHQTLTNWNSSIQTAEVVAFKATQSLARMAVLHTNVAQVISPARDLKKDAELLLRECRAVAQQLMDTVTAIREEVSVQVVRTEPDLSALAAQLGVVFPKLTSATSTAPDPAPEPPAPTQPKSAVPEVVTPTISVKRGGTKEYVSSELSKRETRFQAMGKAISERSPLIESLNLATKELAERQQSLHVSEEELAVENEKIYAAIAPVRGIIDQVNRNVGRLSLTGCLAKSQAHLDIGIFPPSPITTMPGAKIQLWVQGGHPPFELAWPLASDSTNITAEPKIVGDQPSNRKFIIDLSISDKASTRSHTFVLKDMAGFEKAVVIDVRAGQ
jgi:hypothetical protein